MEEHTQILSAAEAAEYGEFKRSKREAEISFTLKRLVIDASGRETDGAKLKGACGTAEKLCAAGVYVSPVNVGKARKILADKAGKGAAAPVCCAVGGTGESLIAVKKTEAKLAARQGAKGIRLFLCYSALKGKNISYLKREIKRIRRAVKKQTLTVSLDDHALTEEEIVLGVRAAVGAKADGVCVRGEGSLVESAVSACAGKLFVEAAGVENAAQLRLLVKAGAVRFYTENGEKIACELYAAVDGEGGL